MCMACQKRDYKGRHYSQNAIVRTGAEFPRDYVNLFPVDPEKKIHWMLQALTC